MAQHRSSMMSLDEEANKIKVTVPEAARKGFYGDDTLKYELKKMPIHTSKHPSVPCVQVVNLKKKNAEMGCEAVRIRQLEFDGFDVVMSSELARETYEALKQYYETDEVVGGVGS